MFAPPRKRQYNKLSGGILQDYDTRPVRAKIDANSQQETLNMAKGIVDVVSASTSHAQLVQVSQALELRATLGHHVHNSSLTTTDPDPPASGSTSAIVVNRQNESLNGLRASKTYACRICRTPLSSSSNRARHERTKHKTQDSVQQSFSLSPTATCGTGTKQTHQILESNDSGVLDENQTCESTKATATVAVTPVVNQPSRHSDNGNGFTLNQSNVKENIISKSSDGNISESDISEPELESDDINDHDQSEKQNHVVMVVDEESNAAAAGASELATLIALDAGSKQTDTSTDFAGAIRFEFEPNSELATAAAAKDATPLESTAICFDGVEGIKSSLQEAELQTQCYPFLCWLTEPAMTPCEALVKARRIKSASQLQPIKNNLRFIFVLLHECGAINTIDLQALSCLSTCQQLAEVLQARQVGHARLHAVFLLIKKVLVFLSSKESAKRKQFLLPSNHSESYLFVDGICSDSSFRRKQEARNRALLGAAASRQLHRSQAAAAGSGAPSSSAASNSLRMISQPFRVPKTWSEPVANTRLIPTPTSRLTTVTVPKVQNVNAQTSSPGGVVATISSVNGMQSLEPTSSKSLKVTAATPEIGHLQGLIAGAVPSPNEMSKLELQQVTQGCVHFLNHVISTKRSASTSHPHNNDTIMNGDALLDHLDANAVDICEPNLNLTPESDSVVDPTENREALVLAAAAAATQAGSSGSAVEFISIPLTNSPCHSTSQSTARAISEFKSTSIIPTLQCHSLELLSDSAIVQPVPVADHVYMAYLITAFLCLCMAPRSQVLRQLRIGSTFVKEADGKYWVRLLADMCKNGKPTLFAVPELLTPAVEYYINYVRPCMVARLGNVAQDHDYLFCKTNGTAPRTDFSTCTNLVTMQLIGRPINPHAFRSAVITTFYGTNASQADMDTLATIMSHDATTARNYYYRPVHMHAAEMTSQRMMTELLLPSPSTTIRPNTSSSAVTSTTVVP